MTEIDTTTDHHEGLSKASYSHGTRFRCTSNGSDLSIEWSRLDICCVTVRPRRLYHTAAPRARPMCLRVHQCLTMREPDPAAARNALSHHALSWDSLRCGLFSHGRIAAALACA